MIKIQVFIDKNLIGEHEFSEEAKELIIGRRPDHHIHLDNIAVSGNHARISISSTVVIEDLKSTNGTMLNGLPIDRPTPLNPGDTIQIAKFSLRINDDRNVSYKSDDATTWLAPTHPLRQNSGEESPWQKTGIYSYKDFLKQREENQNQ